MKILAQRINQEPKSNKHHNEKSQTNLSATLAAPTKSVGLKRQNSAFTPARGSITNANANNNNSEADDFGKLNDKVQKSLSSQMKGKSLSRTPNKEGDRDS